MKYFGKTQGKARRKTSGKAVKTCGNIWDNWRKTWRKLEKIQGKLGEIHKILAMKRGVNHGKIWENSEKNMKTSRKPEKLEENLEKTKKNCLCQLEIGVTWWK